MARFKNRKTLQCFLTLCVLAVALILDVNSAKIGGFKSRSKSRPSRPSAPKQPTPNLSHSGLGSLSYPGYGSHGSSSSNVHKASAPSSHNAPPAPPVNTNQRPIGWSENVAGSNAGANKNIGWNTQGNQRVPPPSNVGGVNAAPKAPPYPVQQSGPPAYGSAGYPKQGPPPPYQPPGAHPPPYGAQPGFGGHPPPYGAQPGVGGHPPPYGAQPGFGGHPPPYGAQPGFGGHPPPYGAQPGFGGHPPPYGAQPGFGGHSPAYGAQPGFGGHPPYGGQPGFSGHPPYGGHSPYGGQQPNFGGHSGYGGQPGYGGYGGSSFGGSPFGGGISPFSGGMGGYRKGGLLSGGTGVAVGAVGGLVAGMALWELTRNRNNYQVYTVNPREQSSVGSPIPNSEPVHPGNTYIVTPNNVACNVTEMKANTGTVFALSCNSTEAFNATVVLPSNSTTVIPCTAASGGTAGTMQASCDGTVKLNDTQLEPVNYEIINATALWYQMCENATLEYNLAWNETMAKWNETIANSNGTMANETFPTINVTIPIECYYPPGYYPPPPYNYPGYNQGYNWNGSYQFNQTSPGQQMYETHGNQIQAEHKSAGYRTTMVDGIIMGVILILRFYI